MAGEGAAAQPPEDILGLSGGNPSSPRGGGAVGGEAPRGSRAGVPGYICWNRAFMSLQAFLCQQAALK